MKQETKKLIEWMKIQLGLLRTNTNEIINNSVDKSIAFLDSLPEIESKLCQGGYIQDRNGIPCCNGDKVRFAFEEEGYTKNWNEKYSRIEIGKLRFDLDTKSFCIVFGPNNNGYDWIDWNTSDCGPEWFEKVE